MTLNRVWAVKRKLHMKKVLLTIIFSISLSSINAEVSQCKIDPPIDTKAKAWCLAGNYLLLESCISFHGFERITQDLGDSWYLQSIDKNPDISKSCRHKKIKVCKVTGKVTYKYN